MIFQEAMQQFKMFAHNVRVQVSSFNIKFKRKRNSHFRIKEGLMADVK